MVRSIKETTNAVRVLTARTDFYVSEPLQQFYLRKDALICTQNYSERIGFD